MAATQLMISLPITEPIFIESDIYLVPCRLDSMTGDFTPTMTSLASQVAKVVSWSHEEDNLLKQIIAQFGAKKWKNLSNELNRQLHNNMNVKEAKHCRERWVNHLNPSLVKGNWSVEEDLIILETQYLQGNKWSEIAKKLTGRTENSVKNRWKSVNKKGQIRYADVPDVRLFLINELKAKLYTAESQHMIFAMPPPSVDCNGFLKPPGYSEIEDQVMEIEKVGSFNSIGSVGSDGSFSSYFQTN